MDKNRTFSRNHEIIHTVKKKVYQLQELIEEEQEKTVNEINTKLKRTES